MPGAATTTMSNLPALPLAHSGTQRTTCPYCGVGCGVQASVDGAGQVHIAGDPAHPANLGRLCSKGSALAATTSLQGRLLHPQIDGRIESWDAALSTTAQRLNQVIDEHGPEAVALYVSGQLLTEDYYVANKLVKGYLGTANIDTNSRLCMSSAVAGHVRAFGADTVPCNYQDLELADMVVITGSNLAWCHPVVYQRLVAAKRQRPEMHVVVIDPRGTPTCDIADQHLALKPGTDVALFNGLLADLHRRGHVDEEFVARHTQGARQALDSAELSVDEVAELCGLGIAEVCAFYQRFGRTEKVVTVFSQGVNQSSAGADKVNSIINCHLLSGRIGRPGMGPFSMTGQPNAMGGREVGGLSNMLAAHLSLSEPGHRALVQAFWGSPHIASQPGLKAVDLFEAVHSGQIKAIWIMATNPVVSLPNANRVREALERCPLVIVSDIREDTDTARLAHIRLPATGWAEKDGTVTNSERRISRQRGFLPAAGEARPDWWIISQVAQRLGYRGFDYTAPAQIFDEHARLSAHANNDDQTPRPFHIGGLAGLSAEQYDALQPIQWPVRQAGDGGTARLCTEHFYTANRRANLVAVTYRAPVHAADAEFPFVLNTGRIRDQWHTMTRTGLAPQLSNHIAEPFVDIHPHDAMLCAVREGALARVRSRWGRVVVRVRFSAEMSRGQIFIPIHWSQQTASDARVGKVVNPAVCPISGEPEFKHTPVSIEPFSVDWHGFVLTRDDIDTTALAWWTRIQGQSFLRYEIAGRHQPDDWSQWIRELLQLDHSEAVDLIEFRDNASALYRAAVIIDNTVHACVFVSPQPDLPSRAWLAALFDQGPLDDRDRISVLAGRPADAAADAGALVCSCFGVGRNSIARAIQEQDLDSPEAIGRCLKAGTNCGSCVPELRQILLDTRNNQSLAHSTD